MIDTGTTAISESPHHSRVKAELQIMLEQPDATVIFLRGSWGCGKTTLVRDIFHSSSQVLYVSLYGFVDIEEVKSSLVLSWLTDPHRSSDKPSSLFYPQTWRWPKTSWALLENRFHGLSAWAKQRLVKKYSKALPAGFHALIDTSDVRIIIFDDLERVSSAFDYSSLWGFLDFIKEKTNINLVLIGNDNEISNSDFQARARKLVSIEKTINHELLLSPSPEWLAEISTRKFRLSESVLAATTEFCHRSGSQNIRILTRAASNLDRVISALHKYALDEHCDIGQIATLYLVLNHSKHDETFDLQWKDAEKLVRLSEFPDVLRDEDGKPSSAYRIATALKLPELPYGDILYEHVDSGVLDEERLVDRINYLVEHATTAKDVNSSERWSAIWSIYADSFDDSAKPLKDEIEKFLEEDSELLTADTYEKLKELASTIDVDVSEYRQDAYIRSIERVHSSDLFNLRKRYEDDEELRRIIDKRVENEFSKMSLDDVTKDALENRGWSDLHNKRIEAEPKEGLVEWLKTPSEAKVDLIRQALTMDKSDRLRGVISELATSSPLNAMRARCLYQIQPLGEDPGET